ncbi:hypothetical protein CEXT_96851 [Caerostris extrusa]|uniref:Uncharacterized protein n=1 Tax=Caerostris extrusa TaxID=172846 RepID=A0AAV4NQ67_CAEEX|nr:hypothetical protein CEXT_96851 [Caerostris extrusa]
MATYAPNPHPHPTQSKNLLKAPCFLSDKMESNIGPRTKRRSKAATVQKKSVIIQMGNGGRLQDWQECDKSFAKKIIQRQIWES